MEKIGLEKAYSSQIHLETRDGERFVVKNIPMEQVMNEVFFYQQLHEHHIPTLQAAEEEGKLVLKYVEKSKTLSDEETPENFFILGQTLSSIHDIHFDSSFIIDERGHRQNIDWNDFIKSQIEADEQAQKEKHGFTPEIIARMTEIIKRDCPEVLKETCLVHGDLHSNNVLLDEGQLFIFDKDSIVAAGDPMIDFALLAINYPGDIYDVGTEEEKRKDRELMKNFLSGYGKDIFEDRETLDAYVLLRSLERWPNPFERKIPEIVDKILAANTL
ncbi:MAG: aminoglycoside phosphotransferase family protein [Patescibacteria group bacterium]|nr:aminoglycoside phosphotransferase family protein [Patescibacteria group bacterium]